MGVLIRVMQESVALDTYTHSAIHPPSIYALFHFVTITHIPCNKRSPFHRTQLSVSLLSPVTPVQASGRRNWDAQVAGVDGLLENP